MAIPELERYEILEELGQGGMSVVYRARDRQLNRDVAVKVLHAFLARQEEARRRFHREAVAVATLHHPGIVEIFDYSGPDAPDSYIVCELIRGRTLRELLEDEGQLPFPELGALIVADLTRALRHAHEQGIIHRDLKPENVMVTDDGRLKLMDFGIAQIMGGATRLTATGTLLGSPAHMAPEMIDGLPSDHRSDIFSLGTILYWLTTGVMPFDAPNPTALFRQILEGEHEPPQACQPRMGNGLARIIERSLRTNPEDRFQDICELQRQLDAELEAVALLPVPSQSQALLSAPRAFADRFGPALVERLAAAGQKALADGNIGRAMDTFNRVLAVDPDHGEVRAAVKRVGRRQRFATRVRHTAVVVGLAVVTISIGFGLDGLGPRRAPAAGPRTPASLAPTAPAPRAINAREASVAGPEAAPKGDAARATSARPPPPAPRKPPRAAAPSPSAPPRRAVVRPPPPPPESVLPVSTTATASSRRHPLLLRMHPGWADVSVNGRRVASGAYRAQLRLTAGQHVIGIQNQYGAAEPRIIRVDSEGRMEEVLDDGTRRVIKGDLPIYTPAPETDRSVDTIAPSGGRETTSP